MQRGATWSQASERTICTVDWLMYILSLADLAKITHFIYLADNFMLAM